MLRFTFRHFLRHWRMNLLLGLMLLVATAFLAALPMFANAIAGRSLRTRLETARPSARNIQVSHAEGRMTAAVWGDMQETLGELVQERVEIRETGSSNVRMSDRFLKADGELIPVHAEAYVRVWSFTSLQTTTEVVAGRFPQYLSPDPNNFSYQVQEVALGPAAAEAMGVGVGDVLYTAGEGLHLHVVGILEPADPAAPVWQNDLLPFEMTRVERGNQPDLVNLSLLVPMPTLTSDFPNHQNYWRVLTDVSVVSMANVHQIRQNIIDLQSRWSTFSIDTGLIDLIDAHLTQLETAQATVFLLSVQSLIFVLYTVAMVSGYAVDRSRGELATLGERGFTGRQMAGVFALEGAFLAFCVAVPLGPPLGAALLELWAGDSVRPIPFLSWQLSAIAALFGWLALVVPTYLATRRGIIGRQRQLARPQERNAWQRVHLDLFLLVLGGLIYWQLGETGTFLNLGGGESPAGTADPLLLLGPSLLLMAVALLFLRFFPLFLRLIAWAGRRLRSLILPFGLARLARDPVAPSRVVLLATLAAGLTFFAVAYDYSISVRQSQMAFYNSGSSLVVTVPEEAGPAGLQELSNLPGVLSASPTYRNTQVRYSVQLGRRATVLAVDPATFPTVTGYPPAITPLRLTDLMGALERAADDAVPAIFSASAFPTDKELGERVLYFFGNQRVTFEVRGIIVNFPALEGAFIVANRQALLQQLDLTRVTPPFTGFEEMWLSIETAEHDVVAARARNIPQARIFSDSEELLRNYRADLPAAETLGALNLNALVLSALSVAVFLAVHYFSARRRFQEFGVLRAIGLSARQLLGLLSLEGLIMMGLGLTAGAAMGYGLAVLMRPFFSSALAQAIAGGSLYTILINWPRILQLYILLAALYLLAMAGSSVALWLAGIQRALRLGEE